MIALLLIQLWSFHVTKPRYDEAQCKEDSTNFDHLGLPNVHLNPSTQTSSFCLIEMRLPRSSSSPRLSCQQSSTDCITTCCFSMSTLRGLNITLLYKKMSVTFQSTAPSRAHFAWRSLILVVRFRAQIIPTTLPKNRDDHGWVLTLKVAIRLQSAVNQRVKWGKEVAVQTLWLTFDSERKCLCSNTRPRSARSRGKMHAYSLRKMHAHSTSEVNYSRLDCLELT